MTGLEHRGLLTAPELASGTTLMSARNRLTPPLESRQIDRLDWSEGKDEARWLERASSGEGNRRPSGWERTPRALIVPARPRSVMKICHAVTDELFSSSSWSATPHPQTCYGKEDADHFPLLPRVHVDRAGGIPAEGHRQCNPLL